MGQGWFLLALSKRCSSSVDRLQSLPVGDIGTNTREIGCIGFPLGREENKTKLRAVMHAPWEG